MRCPIGPLLLCLLAGCSDDTAARPVDAAPSPERIVGRDLTRAEGSRPDLGVDARRGREAGALAAVRCGSTPPPGAALAPALPVYAGTCPSLVAGKNTITSSGAPRQFLLVLPQSPQPGERYPVLFMWHWMAGSASGFLLAGEVQAAVDQQRFIAVIPESKKDIKIFGTVPMPWPFTTDDGEARVQEEIAFFDDMLACVGQQLAVDKECISSAGVSAGALFTVQLAAARADRLASFISLSGGSGSPGGLLNEILRKWTPPARALPGLVLWGGPKDQCVFLLFELASQTLEAQLAAKGHFFVECVHNCGHAAPPIDVPAGESRFGPIWDFAFRHPYWLPPGDSPYLDIGLPKTYSWCGIGKGSATPRTGSCPPPECPY